MTVTETTQDHDARRLAEVLLARASAVTGDPDGRTWRQDHGRYAFDLVLESGRNARVIVSVGDE